MATSIRGRGGRRTAPHASKQLVDRLEPRQLLAVTTLKDFGGLPRELTAVGSFVYFALDEKADGRLSYVDLVGYNVKKGKQQSIRKPDGSKFGQTQYYLSEANDRLVIRERQKDGKPEKHYTLAPGETVARPATAAAAIEGSLAPLALPDAKRFKLSGVTNVTPLGADRYVFIAKLQQKRSRVFTMRRDGSDVKQLDIPGGDGFTSFQQVTAASADRMLVIYNKVDGGQVMLATQGTPATTTELKRMTAGGKVGVLHVHDGVAVGVAGSEPFAFDGTRGDTLWPTQRGFSSVSADSRFAMIGNRLVFGRASHAGDTTDPESLGGYYAPGGSSGSVMMGGITSDSYAAFSFDFDTRELTAVSHYAFAAIRSFGEWGLIASQSTRRDPPNGMPKKIHFSDGTPHDGNHVFDAWRDVQSVGGRAIYSPAWDSSELREFTPDADATITGRVVAEGGLKSAAAVGVPGLKVFLDRDGDGTRSPAEPVLRTDTDGTFTFTNQPSGPVSVRLASYSGLFDAVGESARSVTLPRVGSRSVQFVVREVNPTAGISGVVYAKRAFRPDYYQARANDCVVYIDVDDDGVLDNNEPRTTTDSEGEYTFTQLRAGVHKVRVAGGQLPRLDVPADSFSLVSLAPGVVVDYAPLSGLTMFASQRVKAVLFGDQNRDGVQQAPNDQALYVAGATMFVDLDRDGVVDAGEPNTAIASQDPDGWPDTNPRQIGKLMPGTYLARAIVPSSSGFAAIGSGVEFTVTSREVIVPIPITPADGVLAGRVAFDSNSDGRIGDGDALTTDSMIFADLNADGEWQGYEPYADVNEDGTYSLSGLPRRSLRIGMVGSLGIWGDSFFQSRNLSRGKISGADFVIVQYSPIRIGLYDDRNGNRRRDAGEERANLSVQTVTGGSRRYGWTDSMGVAQVERCVGLPGERFSAFTDGEYLGTFDADQASQSIQWFVIPALTNT